MGSHALLVVPFEVSLSLTARIYLATKLWWVYIKKRNHGLCLQSKCHYPSLRSHQLFSVGWSPIPCPSGLPSRCFQLYYSKIQVKSGLSSVQKPPSFMNYHQNILAQHLTALQSWMMFPASYSGPHTLATIQSMSSSSAPESNVHICQSIPLGLLLLCQKHLWCFSYLLKSCEGLETQLKSYLFHKIPSFYSLQLKLS